MFSIPLTNLPRLQERVAALAAKVERLNGKGHGPFAVPSLTVSAPVEIKGEWYAPVTVNGSEPVQVKGWTFIAALDRMDGAAIVRSTGEIPVEFRHPDFGRCDHCNTRRIRVSAYVLRNDAGAFRQVGSTCLADFIGETSADALAERASVILDVLAACEDEEKLPFGTCASVWALPYVLSFASAAIRANGWTPVSKAQETGALPTKDQVWTALTASKVTLAPDAQDIAKGSSTVAFLREWLTPAVCDAAHGDYLHNLAILAKREIVESKYLGLAVSMIACADREIARRDAASKPAPANVHLGAVGDKLTVKVRFSRLNIFDGMYGATYLYTLSAVESGACVVWGASSEQEVPEGDFYVTGTVKAHGNYRDTLQTRLTRCAFSVEAPVLKKAKAKKEKGVAA